MKKLICFASSLFLAFGLFIPSASATNEDNAGVLLNELYRCIDNWDARTQTVDNTEEMTIRIDSVHFIGDDILGTAFAKLSFVSSNEGKNSTAVLRAGKTICKYDIVMQVIAQKFVRE